ncbi:hypothetical protein F5X99DRAFT_419704 [Biscogniauxia marginata]|nr:hypothetical protein F5X99DRAFT_419704 [Biscogniauxia marginata]
MASFERTSSPVLTMPPSAAHQGAFGMASFPHQSSPLSRFQSFGVPSQKLQPHAANFSAAGRKRSRDEAAINLDVEEAKLETIEPVKEPEDGWIYGEGMTLIKSPSSYVADAGSQSGTWVEEQTASNERRRNEDARAVNQQDRPSLRSSKSQRLDMNAVTIPRIDQQLNCTSPARDLDPTASSPGLSADTSSQPIVDNFTLHLGIGWRRISEDEHIQAAARGWARYIENHFPVTNVRIQLESKGLQSYLVEASEGFFLFAEDLRHGQLVSKDANQALANLRTSPPIFEGVEVMSAAESPKPIGMATSQESAVFMVSTPDYNHSSLALRGPASVVSARPSTRPHLSSRTKRYNRSHVGGASYIPQNEFPIFSHSGDVEISIKAGCKENRYLLHRHTLTRCSGFFEASTSQEWSRASVLPLPEPHSRELTRIGEEDETGMGNSDQRNSVPRAPSPPPRKRWRYELDPGTEGDDIPMLVQRDETSSNNDGGNNNNNDNLPEHTNSLFGGGNTTVANTPVSRSKGGHHAHSNSASSFFRSVANLSLAPTRVVQDPPISQADIDLLRDYDNLFRIFYNYAPVLDGVNIADAYVQCKSLLTLADLYDALAVVGPRVDHHLLQFQSRLWKQIAKYPISYLRLGYLSRSKVIFQEALIHVVGQWPAGERSIRNSFPEIVLDIIEDKVDELEETVCRIEGRLFRLNLTNTRGDRISPQSSYIDWLAVSFFRQWLAENTSPPPQLPPPALASSRQATGHSSARETGPRPTVHFAPTSASTPGAPPSATAAAAATATVPSLSAVGRTYRTLGSPTGAGFLGHDECKRFLKLTPELYSRDNLRRFEKRIDELKTAAREIVRPLMGSGLELELERSVGAPAASGNNVAAGAVAVGSMMGYLTCVRVMERDLPWALDD